MTRYLLIAMFLCSAAPALAQPTVAPPGPPCLVQTNIDDYQIVPGNRSLIVIDRARQRYRLNFITKCYDIQYKLHLRFQTYGVSCLSLSDQRRQGVVSESRRPRLLYHSRRPIPDTGDGSARCCDISGCEAAIKKQQ